MAIRQSAPSTLASGYEDLLEGLHRRPRRIPSKYFYDSEGSQLFERITELPDYYLTRCEGEILRRSSRDILAAGGDLRRLNIVELGAGDGRKTLHLLREASALTADLCYRPVDIAAKALDDLQEHLWGFSFAIEPKVMDLEHNLTQLPLASDRRNLILYLGSSLGNYLPDEQQAFLRRLRTVMNPGDLLLLGLDLKKDPDLLLRAYNDREGVTRAFNFNMLRRLNRELNGDFLEDRFRHWASYNPATGSMESWLVAREEQTVHLAKLDFEMRLDAFEALHVETSWKFSTREIRDLARATRFMRLASCMDTRGWFADELWVK